MTKKPHQTGASATRRHHDTSYRKLFSHPEMVRDLLTGYVRQDWLEVHIMLQQRVEQWNAEILERGRRLGLEEGRQEGRREEMIDLIQGLAQSRFGVLSPELVQRITALPLERGKALVVAFLDFSSVADLEDWLRGSGSFGDRN